MILKAVLLGFFAFIAHFVIQGVYYSVSGTVPKFKEYQKKNPGVTRVWIKDGEKFVAAIIVVFLDCFMMSLVLCYLRSKAFFGLLPMTLIFFGLRAFNRATNVWFMYPTPVFYQASEMIALALGTLAAVPTMHFLYPMF